jgi:hypothetical protein
MRGIVSIILFSSGESQKDVREYGGCARNVARRLGIQLLCEQWWFVQSNMQQMQLHQNRDVAGTACMLTGAGACVTSSPS